MNPNLIENEIKRRSGNGRGIDPNGVPAEPAPIEPQSRASLFGEASEPIWGHIPFELTLTALGKTVTHDCRCAYVVTLYDEGDTRMISSIDTRYELLDWRDPANFDGTGEHLRLPVPRWVETEIYALMPLGIERVFEDLAEEDARSKERAS